MTSCETQIHSPSMSGGGSGGGFGSLIGGTRTESSAGGPPAGTGFCIGCDRKDGLKYSSQCSDADCEAWTSYCYECEPSFSECASCFSHHCESTGNPKTDCLLPCEGKPNCQAEICRLCRGSDNGCNLCYTTVCNSCSKVCPRCNVVSCSHCQDLIYLPLFCQGCNAEGCIVCLSQLRPCDECGRAVNVERLREAMESAMGSVKRWSTASELPAKVSAMRTQLAEHWAAFVHRRSAATSATSPPSAGADAVAVNESDAGGGSGARAGGGAGADSSAREMKSPRPEPSKPEPRAAATTRSDLPSSSSSPPPPKSRPKSPLKTPEASAAEVESHHGPTKDPGAVVDKRSTRATAAAAGEGGKGGDSEKKERPKEEQPPLKKKPPSAATTTTAEGEGGGRGETSAPDVGSSETTTSVPGQPTGKDGASSQAAAGTNSERGEGGGGGGGSGGGGKGGAGWSAAPREEQAAPAEPRAKAGAGLSEAADAPQRSSLDDVSRFVGMSTSMLTSRDVRQQQTVTVESIKKFFSGWVEPGVVDLYYDFTGDLHATVMQCQETVNQVVQHELATKTSPTPAPAPAAASAAASAATSRVPSPPPSCSSPPSPSPSPSPLPPPAPVRSTSAAATDRAAPPLATVGKSHSAGAKGSSSAAANALKPSMPQRAMSDRRRGEASGATAVSLEEQLAELKSDEQRRAATKAKKAARRAEEAAAEEDRELRETREREEAAARRNAAAARAAEKTAAAASREKARIAKVKAATEARAMAAAAALATAEREAKEAAKRKAKEEADAKEASRVLKQQERARAADAARAAERAREEEEEEERRRRRQQQEEEEEEREKEVAAKRSAEAAAAAAAMAGDGGAIVADMTLEVRLKKAIERGNELAVRAIYDEADQTPGAGMKKLKKKCQKWLNKRAGEEQHNQKVAAAAVTAVTATPAPAPAAIQGPTLDTLFCPNHLAGQVIGVRGQTINRLMRESRAKIILKQYNDNSGHDVIITGTPAAVQTARMLIEEFYRNKGIEPTQLPPPALAPNGPPAAPTTTRAGMSAAAGPAARARLSDPTYSTEAMIGRLGRGQPARMPGPGMTVARGTMPGMQPVHPSMSGSGRGGIVELGGGVGGGGGFGGAIPQGFPPAQVPPPPPPPPGVRVDAGRGAMVAGGEGGGGIDREISELLRDARCEHHLEIFQHHQLDGEVLLEMDRREFERMGVTEVEQERILAVLNQDASGAVVNESQQAARAAGDSDEDSDGLDPDHPDTCKICMDQLVGILFLPCAHQCTCVGCGASFVGKPCIICRQTVMKAQKVIRGW